MTHIRKYLVISVSLLIFLSCESGHKEDVSEVILARVGNRSISVDEFIRRSEYTIRPPYARGSSAIDKKRVINALIAEKILAMELGDDPEILGNRHLDRYLKGRQEQAMREFLYYKEGVKKAVLDTSEIKKVYALAGRKYDVQFINLPAREIADSVEHWLYDKNISFDQVYQMLGGTQKIPEREIEYTSQEFDLIHQSLYSGDPQKGQVVGPLKIDERQYLVFRISGWTNRVALSDQQVRQRWNDVKEKLTQQQAVQIYSKFAAELMRGKRFDLHPETFPRLAELLQSIYLRPQDEKKERFLDKTFKRDTEISQSIDSMKEDFDAIRDLPLFTYDNRVWTVRDFEEEFERHPLVFRKKNISNAEFPEQLKFAIADMLRDRELTNVAYKRGYDKINVVRRSTNMWRDAMLANVQKEKYLEQVVPALTDSISSIQLITRHLDPYIDELQAKYSDRIEIDIEEYEDIQLTRIDMFVTQTNVPFPIVVPSFPQLTTDHKLDYGRRMEKN